MRVSRGNLDYRLRKLASQFGYAGFEIRIRNGKRKYLLLSNFCGETEFHSTEHMLTSLAMARGINTCGKDCYALLRAMGC